MKIYKTEHGAIVDHEGSFYEMKDIGWDALINRSGLYDALRNDLESVSPLTGFDLDALPNLPPIGQQEIWASGVTYMRSREARMEESKAAGGGSFYDRVYDAERPELFFKATPSRTVGNLGTVRIRKDSTWDVPEPELVLFVNSKGQIEGYSVGNDMSSRSIEGDNPLYLPQAKTYDGCAGLGPCLYVQEESIPSDTMIRMEIIRKRTVCFSGEVSINTMKRKHQELVDFLFRECSFPEGVFLMTGTGIIPPDDFTLQTQDEIRIQIEPIGTLVNIVG